MIEGRLSLFHKLVLYGMAGVIATGAILTAAFYQHTRTMVWSELGHRGRLMASDLARDSRRGVETRNVFRTLEPVALSAVRHPDVAYAEVRDVEDRLLASAGAPPPPSEAIAMSAPITSSRELLEEDASPGRDPAERLIGTVRLTVSTAGFHSRMRRALLLAAGLLGSLMLAGTAMAWLFSRKLSRPIQELSRAAAAVGAGEHGATVAFDSRDEIGELAGAFNTMSRGLLQATTETRRSHAELQEALRMQAALNEMLSLSLASLPLPQKLEKMLERLISTPWLDMQKRGCVFLLRGAELEMSAQVGMSENARSTCSRVPLGRCLCGRAAQTGSVLAAPELDERHETAYPGMTPHGHLCVPLKGEGRTLGVLNLYLRSGESPTPRQLEFVHAASGIIAGVVLFSFAEERFLQAQKMEAVGLLAGGIAHDFNNVLTTVIGYNYFVTEALKEGDPLRAFSLEVRRAAEFAASLTRQLLAVSRKQFIQPRVLDINTVLTELSRMLRRLLGEGVELVVDPQASLWPVKMDSGQLEQILLNLAVNGRDAMPGGGRLVLATRNLTVGEGEARDLGTGLAPGRYVELSVRDTGTGMDEAVRNRIFEPFFTTKEQGRGTGLGLATVMSIVKQYQGRISVESRLGGGTTFRIHLPAAEGGVEAMLPGHAPASARGGSETILLVEDNDALRVLLKRTLQQKGYRVLAAGSGEEAGANLHKRHWTPDLLLVDLALPGINGLDLAKELRRERPDLKVAYISGYAWSIGVKVDQLKDAVLIEKPFSPEVLLDTVRRVLDAGPARGPAKTTGHRR
ncbi:MAG: ATP-binding protein [Elusimicrobiota bacterium]|jgi:signal transduction histidine kinase/CheY-like chemotaxis protein